MRTSARIARLVNLVLAGMLTGNEFSTLAATHPALNTLPPLARLQAEQAVYRRNGRLMPGYMLATVVSFLPVLAIERAPRSPAFRYTLAGMACFVAMLGITLTRNLPINRRLEALPASETSDAEFRALRDRWDRLHAARNLLNIAGLVCACLGAMARIERGHTAAGE
jgi:uncharacterized membrane protein